MSIEESALPDQRIFVCDNCKGKYWIMAENDWWWFEHLYRCPHCQAPFKASSPAKEQTLNKVLEFASQRILEAFNLALEGEALTPDETRLAWTWFERGVLAKLPISSHPTITAPYSQAEAQRDIARAEHPFPCLAGVAQPCQFPNCTCRPVA